MSTALVHVPRPSNDEGPGFEFGGGQEERGHGTTKDWRLLRRALIAEMLLLGTPQRQIAKQVGCSKGVLHKEITRIRAEWRARHEQAFDDQVAQARAVLDKTRAVALTIATSAAAPAATRLAAIDRVLATHDREARLVGMDKPVKIDATVHVDVAAKKERGHELVDQLRERREAKAG